MIAEHFIPGRVAPVGVVTDFDAASGVVGALSEDPRVPIEEMYLSARSVPAPGREDLALSEAYLSLDPFSQAATDSVPAIRAAARAAAEGSAALVGGEVAEAYDTQQALARDTRLIVPDHARADPADPRRAPARGRDAAVRDRHGHPVLRVRPRRELAALHARARPARLGPEPGAVRFIFLVALGVDYNVFLLARIREEREHLGTEAAVAAALERTGGIITSAGLVLAATFAVLMALELEALFQVGFVVALGLLADTFLVRALLVPAIAILLGDRTWWPHRF